jgi:hypothetical protein
MFANQSRPMASMVARASDTLVPCDIQPRRTEKEILRQQGALAAVAARNHRSPADYEVWNAPEDSIHTGLWYASERNVMDMPIDDCVWLVLPDGSVRRGIPVGNPIHEPTLLNLDD